MHQGNPVHYLIKNYFYKGISKAFCAWNLASWICCYTDCHLLYHTTPLPVNREVFLTLLCLGPLVLMHLLLMWVDICVQTVKNSPFYARHAYYSKLTRGLSSVTIFLCGTSLNIWQKSQGPFPLWAFLYTSFSFFPQGGAIFCLHSFFNWWTYHSNHMAHANEEP